MSTSLGTTSRRPSRLPLSNKGAARCRRGQARTLAHDPTIRCHPPHGSRPRDHDAPDALRNRRRTPRPAARRTRHASPRLTLRLQRSDSCEVLTQTPLAWSDLSVSVVLVVGALLRCQRCFRRSEPCVVLEALVPVARSPWLVGFDWSALVPRLARSLPRSVPWPAWHGMRRSSTASASGRVAAALWPRVRCAGGHGAGHARPTTLERGRPLGVVRRDRDRGGRTGAATGSAWPPGGRVRPARGDGRSAGCRGDGRWCSAAWLRRGRVGVPGLWRTVRGAPGGPPDLLAWVRPP
jgi:hypothetical protein